MNQHFRAGLSILLTLVTLGVMQPARALAAAPSTPLVLAPQAGTAPSPSVCFATIDSFTVYSSVDAIAVQQAVDAAASGALVKVAGLCAGVQFRAGTNQTVYISKTLTLEGGYVNTPSGWLTSDPVANPTILDASSLGRVIFATAPVTISGLTAQNGRAGANNDGGGMYVAATAGSVTLSAMQILSNTAGRSGGGMYISGTTASRVNAVFIDTTLRANTAMTNGGGVNATSNTTVTLSNALFITNTAGQVGGGAFLDGRVDDSGSTFTRNYAGATSGNFGAGGLYARSATLTSTQFLTNTTARFGGGLGMLDDLVMNGGLFAGNSAFRAGGLFGHRNNWTLNGTQFIANSVAGNGGGAAYFNNAGGTQFITLNNVWIERNTSDNFAGGIFINAPNTTLITASTFLSNTAPNAGALSTGSGAAGSTLLIYNSRFEGNQSTAQSAGAVQSTRPSQTVISKTTFLRNTAATDAGAVLVTAGSAQLVNNLFAGNTAGSNLGAAAVLSSTSAFTLWHNTFAGSAMNPASAVHVVTGSAQLRNNIVASHTTGINVVAGTSSENYNLFDTVATPRTGISAGANSAIGSAAFVSPASDDYQFTVASRAINIGPSLGVSDDFFGNPRPQQTLPDAGYFESPFVPVLACNTEINGDNLTDYSSNDAQAVRDAVAAVAAGGTVKVAGNCAGAITQDGTPQVVLMTQTLTLMGGYTTTNWLAASDPASHPTVLDAVAGGRVIFATQPMTASALTVQNGYVPGAGSLYGGGIYADSDMTLTNMRVVSNRVDDGELNAGGGAYIRGVAVVSGSTFISNAARLGGGVYVLGASSVRDSSFISNTAGQFGGGATISGTATVVNSRFERNTAALDGGGLLAYTTLDMTGTTFISNTATRDGGGVRGVGNALIVDSTFTGNSALKAGGGVFDNALTMANTLFMSNTAGAGSSSGGIAVNGIAALTDVTFTLNSAGSGGAGGANFGSTAVLTGGAFLSNTANFAGGGAYFNGTAIVSGTQFAGNRALSNRGGGAYFNGAATLNNTVFAGNVAFADRGAGAYFRVGADVAGSRFISNTASNRAGGAYFNANATLTDTDFISNTGTARAGGVYIGGNGVVNGGVIQGNVCNSSCAGGGLFISGTLTLSGTQFLSNTAQGDGGGAYTSADATMNGVTFAGNQSINTGGGLFHAGSTLTVTRSGFVANTTNGFGGGLNVANTRVANVVSSTFTGNSASSGGGIIVAGNATLNVTASTFAGNQAGASVGEMGGGLYSFGSADIANSTFAGNQANNGGALGNGGNMTVTNSTIAANTAISGAGIANDPDVPAPVTLLRNTLVASQTAGANCAFTAGTLTADGFNMADDASCDSAAQRTTAQIALQALANNGSDTATMALGAGSAALEVGDDTVCAAAPVNNIDQRGVARPQNARCDVGAFELVWTNGTPTSNAGVPQSALVNTLVMLDGSGSSDPDGHALTFGWTQTSGTAVSLNNGAAVSPTFTAPGVVDELVFQLVVTDAFGAASAPALVTVTVTNGAPTADAGVPQTVYVSSTVTLSGSASNDPESQPLTFGWSQVGGTPVLLSSNYAVSPSFTTPSTASVLVFQLVVTDSSGLASAPAFVTVTVIAEPVIGIPPGEVWITVTTGIARLQPTTDFSATLITGTEPITFVWDFGDGSPQVEGREASHVYGPGTYTATLTATNSAGTVTSTIHVFVPYRVLLALIARDAVLPAWLERR